MLSEIATKPAVEGSPAPRRPVMNILEVAHELGICRNSVIKLKAQGRLRFVKLVGRNVVTRSEFDRFIASLTQDAS